MNVKQAMTAEDVLDLPERLGVLLELVDEELREVPGATALHRLIAAMVYELIRNFAQNHDPWLVFPHGADCVLRRGPDLLRIPAVAATNAGYRLWP